MDGVEWLVLDDASTGLAMYRTGQLDCGPEGFWAVRQHDLDVAQAEPSPPDLPGFPVPIVPQRIFMRTDQPPFNDVRVRRAISHAIDRQALIEAVLVRGEPTAAVSRGLPEWSLPIDQLGAGAKYYQYDPQGGQAPAGGSRLSQGLQNAAPRRPVALARDLVDAVQLVQRSLKDVGIEAELKLQEYGAYMATTIQGKFEGLAMGPVHHRLGAG